MVATFCTTKYTERLYGGTPGDSSSAYTGTMQWRSFDRTHTVTECIGYR